MTFLIAKIILMLVLAAALGAWLAWLRWQRRFIEVTTEYHALRDGWAAWRNAIDARLAEPPSLEPQLQAPLAAALAPLVQRLQALEDAVRRMQAAPMSAPPPNAAPGIDAGELAARFHAMQAVLISTLESALAGQAVQKAPAAQPVQAAGAGAGAAKLPAAAAAATTTTTDSDPEPEAAATPAAPAPPLHEQVRSGSRNLLQGPAYGRPDELKRIKGVGNVLEKMLHDIGVYYFWQIAEWTGDDVAHADAQLTSFKGRIARDGWVVQAQRLMQGAGAAAKPAA
jgi:predicted flap endonuclease-1-like 5' DNA nuclease